mmetsp:Transcript_17084/g.24966  ORF Transcript_17084/g.24966 Transcript_17084/m.24966 type:complete len:208 (-) Transcript_17084:181-804(-)
MRRTSMSPDPLPARALEMRVAASASPSARMMAAFRSWSALATTYCCLSASCWATCFDSMALAYSRPKVRCVIDTSSKIRLKAPALFLSASLIFSETSSRLRSRSSALYCATMAFNTSLPRDGNTRSSKSVPSVRNICDILSSSGLLKTRREMLTICRSFVPVTEFITLGLALISRMWGSCMMGMRKCIPSPHESGRIPLNLSNITAL